MGEAKPIPLDINIPLTDQRVATLRVPNPMSEEDFATLEEMLTENLRIMKRVIVTAPEEPTDDE